MRFSVPTVLSQTVSNKPLGSRGGSQVGPEMERHLAADIHEIECYNTNVSLRGVAEM
jgi:hypothetical protein